MVRLLPISLTIFSSFGRLYAAVCTPRLPSPLENIELTTRIGASAPSLGLRNFGSIGRLFSISCSSEENLANFDDSASSRTAMDASKPALEVSHTYV